MQTQRDDSLEKDNLKLEEKVEDAKTAAGELTRIQSQRCEVQRHRIPWFLIPNTIELWQRRYFAMVCLHYLGSLRRP